INDLKYYPKWKDSLKPGVSSITDEQPWITFPVIDLLKQNIQSNSKIFEYGGGGRKSFAGSRASDGAPFTDRVFAGPHARH
ncbi:MAG: hypothetical protein ACXW3C_09760, partial [Pyrinomonadaceae bacterium]